MAPMRATETFTVRVALRWGHDSRRDIEVPVRYEKGEGRWYVRLATGETLGWLCRRGRTWTAYCPEKVARGYGNEFGGVPVAEGATVSEAAEDLVVEHALNAHRSPIFPLAEAAYA